MILMWMQIQLQKFQWQDFILKRSDTCVVKKSYLSILERKKEKESVSLQKLSMSQEMSAQKFQVGIKKKMVKMLAITRCLTSPSPTIFANVAPDHTTKFVIISIPLLIFHLINVYMFITFIYIKKKINIFFINLTTSYSQNAFCEIIIMRLDTSN